MGGLTFILHDESVNTYGFRMLTGGANLEEFKKNPVMLLNHNDYSLPIGRWENIRVEGGKILADAVFDKGDPQAAEVQRKVDNGFVRMASVGAWPPEEKSDAFHLMLPGQTLPTVTKWTVREASIVTIGSNHNALVFYDRDSKQIIDLKEKNNLIRLIDHSNNPKIQVKMSVLTGVLKLQDAASEAEIVAAVQGIIKDHDRLKNENETLTAAIDKMNTAKKASQKQEAISLTDAYIKGGRYDAKGRDYLLNLFDKDFEGTKAMMEAIPERASVTAQITSGQSGVTLGDWKDKTWDELDKAGKLVELRDAAPDVYKVKFKERFGIEPKL
jgi:hypothetical protein